VNRQRANSVDIFKNDNSQIQSSVVKPADSPNEECKVLRSSSSESFKSFDSPEIELISPGMKLGPKKMSRPNFFSS
jgi:hypothetical protein